MPGRDWVKKANLGRNLLLLPLSLTPSTRGPRGHQIRSRTTSPRSLGLADYYSLLEFQRGSGLSGVSEPGPDSGDFAGVIVDFYQFLDFASLTLPFLPSLGEFCRIAGILVVLLNGIRNSAGKAPSATEWTTPRHTHGANVLQRRRLEVEREMPDGRTDADDDGGVDPCDPFPT